MTADEATKVSEIVTSTIRSLNYYNVRAKEEEIRKYSPSELLSSSREDADSVLLAKERQDIIGFCISKYDDGLIWLSWFGVEESHRKKGVGEQLLFSLEATATKRKAHKIWCDTRTVNLTAQRALQKAGYRQIATLKNHWYGQDFLLWEKIVDETA
ncbi:MAG TPA: GNAT family N-acetyltransferase [Pyrinomonadaceae bacterium]|nr:GNAT family N-acetyltransferase [Pyrinomonadaceae bacterium]